MKLFACIIIGFTVGALLSYCALRERSHQPLKMHATVELRDRERFALKTDDL